MKLKKQVMSVLLGVAIMTGSQWAAMGEAAAETSFGGHVSVNIGHLLMAPFYHNDNSGSAIGVGVGPQSALPNALPGTRENQKDPYYEGGALAIVRSSEGVGLMNQEGVLTIPADQKAIRPLANGYLAVVAKDSKEITYVTPDGKALADQTWGAGKNEDDRYSFKDKKTKRYGFKNELGEVVIAPQFREVYGEFSEGRAFVKNARGKKVAIDVQGQTVFEAPYDSVSRYEQGLAEVRRNSTKIGLGFIVGKYFGDRGHDSFRALEGSTYDNVKRGYINREGQIIIDSRQHKVYPMTDYGAVVENKGKMSFVNREGQVVIGPAAYAPKGMNLTYGWLAVENKKTDKVGVLDVKTGAEVLPFQYHKLQFLTHGLAAAWSSDKSAIAIIRVTDAEKPVFTLSHEAWFNNFGDEGYMWVRNDTMAASDTALITKGFAGYKIIDTQGKVLFEAHDLAIEKVSLFRHGHTAVKVDGKWGIMNAHGQWLVPPTYKEITLL